MTPNRLVSLFLLLFCVSLAAAPSAHSQSEEALIVKAKEMLADGVDHRKAGAIQQARATFERLAQADTDRPALAHYYSALAYRRLMDITEDEEASLRYVDSSLEHLEKAIEIDDTFGEAHALLASQYGRKMAIKPMYGMVLGPKADKAMTQAAELAPESPRVAFLKAQSDYFTPEQWGGDKERALRTLQRAIALFEGPSEADFLRPTWGHDEAYAWLGIMQMREENYTKAKDAFQQALKVNPESGWVKDVLLPKATKALAARSPAPSSDSSSDTSPETPNR